MLAEVATGTLLVSLSAQVVCVQLLPPFADEDEHDATGTSVVLLVPQTVAVQLLLEVAVMGLQLFTPVGPVVTGGGHVFEV